MVRESDSSLWLNKGFKIAPPTHRYNTRLQSRIIMEEQAAEIEQLRKTNEDLQKKLDQMAEMMASMRQQNIANSGNNSNGQSSQSTFPHGLPTAQPTNASLSPSALNIPLQKIKHKFLNQPQTQSPSHHLHPVCTLLHPQCLPQAEESQQLNQFPLPPTLCHLLPLDTPQTIPFLCLMNNLRERSAEPKAKGY